MRLGNRSSRSLHADSCCNLLSDLLLRWYFSTITNRTKPTDRSSRAADTTSLGCHASLLAPLPSSNSSLERLLVQGGHMRMFHVATRSGGRDSERNRPILRGEAPCFNTAWVRTDMSALYQRNRSPTFPLRARRLGGLHQYLRVSRPSSPLPLESRLVLLLIVVEHGSIPFTVACCVMYCTFRNTSRRSRSQCRTSHLGFSYPTQDFTRRTTSRDEKSNSHHGPKPLDMSQQMSLATCQSITVRYVGQVSTFT
jgi:hypothetical protein